MKRLIRKLLTAVLPKNKWGDAVFLTIMFIYAHRRIPRRSSGLFNDYYFFLKTGDNFNDPSRIFTSDKFNAKIFLKGILGKDLAPLTLGLLTEQDRDSVKDLPKPCVLKPSHGSGLVYFLSSENYEYTKEFDQFWSESFQLDIYDNSREKNYKNLLKRIIAEEVLDFGASIKDYKVFCYHGEPRFIKVISDGLAVRKQNIYSPAWKKIDVVYNGYPRAELEPAPLALEEMLGIARKCAAHFSSVRVDFYIVEGRVYIGELTHCHNQGHGKFSSLEEERLISDIFFGRKPASTTGAASLS